MSPPDSTERIRASSGPRPKPDVYTVFLVIALVAVLIGCVCLFLEFRSYNYDAGASAAGVQWYPGGEMPAWSQDLGGRSLLS